MCTLQSRMRIRDLAGDEERQSRPCSGLAARAQQEAGWSSCDSRRGRLAGRAWLAATRRCPAPADYFWGVRMQSRSVAVLSLSASGRHGSSMAGVEGRRGGGARRRSGRAAPGNGRVAAPRQEQLAEVASPPACVNASKLDGGQQPTARDTGALRRVAAGASLRQAGADGTPNTDRGWTVFQIPSTPGPSRTLDRVRVAEIGRRSDVNG